jgi:hypothetical protein
MPWVVHDPKTDPCPVAAVAQVIGESSLSEFRTWLRARAPGVGLNIPQGLMDQGVISQGSVFTEFPEAPSHNFGDVPARRVGYV